MTWPNWLPIFALYAIRRLTPKISLIAFGSPLPIDAPEAFLWVTSWILEFEARRTDVFRFQTVIRLYRPLQRTPLLARQPCAVSFSAIAQSELIAAFAGLTRIRIKVGAVIHTVRLRRTALGRPFERRSPRSA
jgi:hypothetical protein